ncbi:unnamed protein product [Urochloa decumbens]|uniref:Essential protein Yae1 N-terminal domain-containing protein n=1 Tax=Urochloa decumbens TaxID=240449 RepID=A0ABC9GB07_9POAL
MNQKVDDFLEPSVLVEETHYGKGFRIGYAAGLVSGKEDARKLGLNMGFQVSEELGFYQGCLDVWIAVAHINHGAFSDRMKKNLEQMAALVSSYPISNPENEQIQEIMGQIRLKFRIITANLGVKLEHGVQSKSLKQGLEDL